VIQRIVRAPPSLARARPDLPRWLHAFSDRMLKVNPSHRFANAKDALRALDTKRVPRPPLNRRALLVTLLAIAALGGVVAYFWRNPLPLQQLVAPVIPATPRVAVLPFTAPRDDAEAAALARAFEAHAHEWLRGDAALAVASRERVRDAMARTAPDLHGDALTRQLPDIARAANATRVLRGELHRDKSGPSLDLSWIDPESTSAPQTITIRGADAAALLAAYSTSAAGLFRSVDSHIGAPPPLTPSALPAFGRGLLALDAGKSEAAAEELAGVANTAPASALIALSLLAAQDQAHQDLPAQNTREDALNRFAADKSPAGRELHARALAENGDAAGAAQALATIDKEFPHDPSLALQYAEILDENGNGAEALERLRKIVRIDDQDARAWFLLGRIAIQQAQARRAVDEYLVRAMVLNTRSGDAAAEAQTRNAMGVGYEHLGQLDAAVEQYARAAAMREKLGDKNGLAKSLRNLAIVEAVQGKREAAEQTLDRVKGLLEEIGDEASLADLYNDRGVVAEERGDFAAAVAAYREGLAIRRRLDDPALIAESLDNIGFSSYQLGQFDDALVYWQQALALYQKVDDQRGTLHVEQSIGLLDMARGHFASAQDRLQASLRKAEDSQLPEEVAAAQINLADLFLLEGRLADAASAAERAQQFFARRSDQRGEVESNLSKARIALTLGDGEGADKALAAIPTATISNEQRAAALLATARRASLAGDKKTAVAKIDEAAAEAEKAHSGTLDFRIRVERARAALADGDRVGADKLLAEIGAETGQLGQVPFRLEWLELRIAAALRAGKNTEAANRYREALPLLKEAGRYTHAATLHALGALALPANGAEAAAAKSAAEAARQQLLADAPAAARASLEQELARRLQQDTGNGDAR